MNYLGVASGARCSSNYSTTPNTVPSEDTSDGTEWIIWQMIDSAFPTGGYAHSQGLEAAYQYGEVRNGSDLLGYAESSVYQAGYASVPLVTAAFDQPERLSEFDQLCDAFTPNHVANRASRLQGRAFWSAIDRVFLRSGSKGYAEGNGRTSGIVHFNGVLLDRPVLGHFPPTFGSVCRILGLNRRTTIRAFLFQQVRCMVTAAVRLNIVGPLEAQKFQRLLVPTAESVLLKCSILTLEDLAQTAPLLEIWQGGQDRLYSRLFQS